MANFIDIVLRAQNETDAAFRNAAANVKELNQQQADMRKKAVDANTALQGLRGVLGGNVAALGSLSGKFAGVGMAIGGVAGGIGVLVAAWKLGERIGTWFADRMTTKFHEMVAASKAASATIAADLRAMFTTPLQAADKDMGGFIQRVKDAGAEAERVNKLQDRKAAAEKTIAESGVDAATMNTPQDQVRAEAEIARIKAAQAEIQKRIADAKQAEARADADIRGAAAQQGTDLQPFRKALEDARTAAGSIEAQGKKELAALNNQIEEQETRIVEARAKGAQALADEVKAAEELGQKRVQALADEAQAAKAVADAEFNDRQAGLAEMIQTDADKIAALQEQLAGIADTREERKAQKAEERGKTRDQRREDELIERQLRGAKLGPEAKAFLERRQIERDIEVALANKQQAEKDMRTEAERKAQESRDETLRVLRENLEKTRTLLQAAGGA
jgi:hypothetical protein